MTTLRSELIKFFPVDDLNVVFSLFSRYTSKLGVLVKSSEFPERGVGNNSRMVQEGIQFFFFKNGILRCCYSNLM